MKLAKCTLAVVLLVSPFWFLLGGYSKMKAESMACNTYLKSRKGSHKSIGFITVGIKDGMNELEVENILRESSVEVMRRLKPENSEYISYYNYYAWQHGTRRLWYEKEDHHYKEWFMVGFDASGKARTIDRYFSSGFVFFWMYDDVYIDLSQGKIISIHKKNEYKNRIRKERVAAQEPVNADSPVKSTGNEENHEVREEKDGK
jgi:hypothetical protein